MSNGQGIDGGYGLEPWHYNCECPCCTWQELCSPWPQSKGCVWKLVLFLYICSTLWNNHSHAFPVRALPVLQTLFSLCFFFKSRKLPALGKFAWDCTVPICLQWMRSIFHFCWIIVARYHVYTCSWPSCRGSWQICKADVNCSSNWNGFSQPDPCWGWETHMLCSLWDLKKKAFLQLDGNNGTAAQPWNSKHLSAFSLHSHSSCLLSTFHKTGSLEQVPLGHT